MHRNNYRKNCFLPRKPVRVGKALGLILNTIKSLPCKHGGPSLILRAHTKVKAYKVVLSMCTPRHMCVPLVPRVGYGGVWLQSQHLET